MFKLPSSMETMVDHLHNRPRKPSPWRLVFDYVRGVLFGGIGIYIIIHARQGNGLLDAEPGTFDYALGLVFVLYGLWRIYVGIKRKDG